MTNRIVVAGAGIGGLTAALALARAGRDTLVVEAAERLEEIGAGIQLSPNASRVLIALGLRERLASHVVSPRSVSVGDSRSGRMIVEMPLDETEARHGAPYWVIHRGELQHVLLDACDAEPRISIRLGTAYASHTAVADGVAIGVKVGSSESEERSAALIGADGIRSSVRRNLGMQTQPAFQARVAWRALIPVDRVRSEFQNSRVHLWLGPDAHLVHYPVQGGRTINIVAVTRGDDRGGDWTAPVDVAELASQFHTWAAPVRSLLGAAEHWSRWSLFSLPSLPRWGAEAVTLLGDAAHAMPPFIAQGAAMAIEDAAILAQCLANASGSNVPSALRAYEAARHPRTSDMLRAAHRAGAIYHLPHPAAFVRNLGMRIFGGERLNARQDWIYNWRPGAE